MKVSPPKWKWFGAGAPQILHKQLRAGGDRWATLGFISRRNSFFGFISRQNSSSAIWKWDVCHFCERGVKIRLQSVQFLILVSSYSTLAINNVCYMKSIHVLWKCLISTQQKYASHFSTITWHIFGHVCLKVLSLLDVMSPLSYCRIPT